VIRPARFTVCRLTLCGRQRGPSAPRAVLGGDALQVESLSDDVRERAVAAVEQLGAPLPVATRAAPRSPRPPRAHLPRPRHAGGRVTVGDVAAKAGLQLSEASSALNALATDTGAAIKVSDAGDLLYVYRPGVRAMLAAKSWRLRLAPALAKARGQALRAGWALRCCDARADARRRAGRRRARRARTSCASRSAARSSSQSSWCGALWQRAWHFHSVRPSRPVSPRTPLR
jgi:hypothetical protein